MSKLIDTRKMSFITDEGKIDIDQLQIACNSLMMDAVKCNKGNYDAGRRFRLNTVDLEKRAFLDMRKVSPVAPTRKSKK